MTGGSGTLGSELQRINEIQQKYRFLCPRSWELNIVKNDDVYDYFVSNDFDLVLHCAGDTNTKDAQIDSRNVVETNVIGTSNIVYNCICAGKRLIHISTDHVFDGTKGDYIETDYINPLTNYAKTKAAAELVVRTYKNSLVIRTSFFKKKFPFDAAFVDQFSTKDYVDIIAPMIYDWLSSEYCGIVHVGSKKRTIIDIAKSRKSDVKPLYRNEVNFPTPYDTSLVSTEFK